ncbi:laccase domain-containing protein [bacterium]|nr:laccase domain-containing protein [bacterium]
MIPPYLQYDSGIVVTTRRQSLELTLDALGLTNVPLIRMHQTHSATIGVVDTPIPPGTTWLDNTDAIVSNQPGVLAIKTADCLPVIISHPSGWTAAIHAGRRGTESGITQKAAEMIANRAGTTDGFSAWLGPRICVNCYQIDPVTDLHFDLVHRNRTQLFTVFGSALTIDDCGHCTACRNDLFFSYRKEATSERIFSIKIPT